ncbi:Hypoxia up-regulated protein 1 [Blattella germanica]|nr:Hypoxia up-regulated protein 1 [Blattella germanica]
MILGHLVIDMDIKIFVSLLMLFAVSPHVESVAVMSVDLGSEWMKIAIVSPGVPMEIALNKESKRKTPVTIAFRDGERTFGEDAATLGVRFPKNSYSYLLELLGKRVDNPIVQLYQQRFPYYEIVPDSERDTVVFKHDSETFYSPEELLGMLLHRAREFAQDSAGQPINEAVLTVPGFFNQAERKALLKAAELAGLKVLQLMNDYTAVALNYGIFRRKDFNESAQYIMFYDMGATSTTATIVSYQMVKTKEKGYVETNPQLSIIGVGDYLGKKFNELKKTPNDVFKNPRAMAKLFKEAGRVKNVLSANADHYAQVEGLLDDVDFKLQVTREEFETMCSDLFGRVILVGAGTRVPKVQEKLSEIVGMELGKSINTDEAAAMGAVYKAADLSNGFKVKKFLTKDAVLFPIQRMLFGPMNPFPQKKILTFSKHQNDFAFHVCYAELDHLSHLEVQAIGPLNLSKVELTGIAEALGKHQGNNIESKGIKAHFAMDESGLLNLANVELVVEKTLTEEELAAQEESPLSKLGSTISNFFTGSEEKKEKTEEKPVKEEPEEEKKSESDEKEAKSGEEEKKEENTSQQEGQESETDDKKKAVPSEEAKNASKSTATGEKKPKIVVIKEAIASTEEKLGVPELAGTLFQDAVKKLEALNEFDRQRNRRESALNALESFVSDWLYEEGADADAATYESKLSELKTLTGPLYRRVKEHMERPEALAALHSLINGSSNFLATARNMSGENPDGLFTPVELDTLERVIKETEVKYLVNKAKIWKPKKAKDDSKEKETAKNETFGDTVSKEENIETEEEGKSPEDAEAQRTERADKEDERTEEEIVPSLPDPEEGTTNLPEKPAPQTDGEEKDRIHTEL